MIRYISLDTTGGAPRVPLFRCVPEDADAPPQAGCHGFYAIPAQQGGSLCAGTDGIAAVSLANRAARSHTRKENIIMNDTFDAHVHTCCSDAAPDQTPEEVCRAAWEAGLGHLCITDHDRMLPENQRRALTQAYGLDVISGCEFSGVTALSTDRRVTVHVLGLWLPEQSQTQVLSAVLAHNQAQDFPSYCKAML